MANLINDYLYHADWPKLVEKNFREQVNAICSTLHGLGFCLSEELDILSQWRAYADDGHGFSIGFSREYFRELAYHFRDTHLSFVIEEVEYSEEEHENIVFPLMHSINYQIMQALESANGEVIEKTWLTANYWNALIEDFTRHMYRLKSSAFEEEREWRFINFHGLTSSRCDFRVGGRGRIVPYKSLPLTEVVGIEPIVRVVLGPKNITPENIIQELLKANGFSNVDVLPSRASYR